MDLCNLSTIKSIMAEAGITFRKEFGQNFLTNRIIPEEISENCADTSDRLIIEIGPGIGCLTQELAMRYSKVVAVEIDKGLIPVLARTLEEFDNITVINDDIMKIDIAELVEKYSDGKPVSVCANLPYYITTPVLMHLLESGVQFEAITVMVQKEVADRLCAKAGTSEYGAITVTCQRYGKVVKLFDVPKHCFYPVPGVDSAVVSIIPAEKEEIYCKDEQLLTKVIRATFNQRRKTLVNALSAEIKHLSKAEIAEVIVKCGHREDIRGEKLTLAQFAEIVNNM